MVLKKKQTTVTSVIIFLLGTILFSCKKHEIPPCQKPSKMELLTTFPWIYDTIIRNWQLPKQAIVYVRGSTSNPEDWSLEQVKFNQDSTFNEILPNGGTRNGNWYFNSDSTKYTTYDYWYSNTATIEELTSKRFAFVDELNHIRAVMSPKK